jgi:uncharacterized protein with GYD domain
MFHIVFLMPNNNRRATYHPEIIPLKRRQAFRLRRHAYILLVKLRKGKRKEDFVEFFERVDKKLVEKYGRTRHGMDVHERVTYVTRGRYDLVVLYDAPSPEVERRFRAAWLKNGGAMEMSDGLGTGDIVAITGNMKYRHG